MNLDPRLNDFKCKVIALDDMFDCPVCFERLTGNVPQCTQGHHLCERCWCRLFHCPVCKRNFNGTRNYFLESMIIKFEEMKNSLKHLGADSLLIAKEQKTELLVIGEGKFPCAGEKCNKLLSFCDMVRHIKREHAEDLNDIGPIKYRGYNRTWIIIYDIDTVRDEIVYIHNMGIFFVKIYISQRGNVYGNVQMANSVSNAQLFHYTLEVGNYQYAKLFRGQVMSTKDLHKKSTYLCIDHLLWTDDDDDNVFRCKLTLTYSP